MELEKINSSEYAVFKKKLVKLGQYKGKGTELISVYIPPETDRGTVMSQLTEEISQSSNIKSPTTRKNVQGALRKIINFLKQINFKIPEKGIVVFAGNISEQEGKTDLRLFTVRPLKQLQTKLYWCDSEFHLAPLKEMMQPSANYALIAIDKNEATIAILSGMKYEVLTKYTSGVAGKARAGGQCMASDTLIPLPNGKIVEIKSVHNPLPVISGDFKNFNSVSSIITDKWETEKIPVKIITKYPRFEISASKDHAFFVFENGKIFEKTVSDLSAGDRLIFPERLRIKGKTQKLNTIFFNSYSINSKGRKVLLQKRKQKKLSQKELAKQINATQTAISGIELGKRNSRRDFLFHYVSALGLQFREFVKKYCKQEQKNTLPEKLDYSLAQIIGYWIGDGNTEKERVCFSEQDKQVAEFYASELKRIFNANISLHYRKNKGYYQIRAYGKPIVKFLQSEFPEKHTALDLEIPKKILLSPNNVLAGFLRGIFDAEGCVSRNRIGFGVNNKKLASQLQLVLLRFSIISSLLEYDNKKNIYSKNHRFSIDISEKESIKLFQEKIGFSSIKKKQKLRKAIDQIAGKSSVRQILSVGSDIRKIIEEHGWKKQRFIEANMFLQDRRKISKIAFKKSIIEKAKTNPELALALQKFLHQELLPVEIAKIRAGKKPVSMTDISVQNQNFIAQGIIVHNSAKRFEHLREEAAQDFYKRISEKVNSTFLPYGEKLKGIIIGGPGITKNYFLNKDLVDHRLKKKIIGQIDTSYTDESGIREMVQKSEEILKDTDLMKERKTVNDFLNEIAKDGLGAYGEKEVLKSLELGKVGTLLLSEDLEGTVIRVKCEHCGKDEERIIKEKEINLSEIKCSECKSNTVEVLEEIDYLDYLIEKAQETGAEVTVVSTETSEGEQFLKAFGGIGGMLRYK
jgi:peptide subunit release factor 1 (eRF1)/intein/homing endonuclease